MIIANTAANDRINDRMLKRVIMSENKGKHCGRVPPCNTIETVLK